MDQIRRTLEHTGQLDDEVEADFARRLVRLAERALAMGRNDQARALLSRPSGQGGFQVRRTFLSAAARLPAWLTQAGCRVCGALRAVRKGAARALRWTARHVALE